MRHVFVGMMSALVGVSFVTGDVVTAAICAFTLGIMFQKERGVDNGQDE